MVYFVSAEVFDWLKDLVQGHHPTNRNERKVVGKQWGPRNLRSSCFEFHLFFRACRPFCFSLIDELLIFGDTYTSPK